MQKISKVIFVGGIHGVGKTTYCKKNYKDYNTMSCSSLIARYKELNKEKLTDNIVENQRILENSFKDYVDTSIKTILDGHFCLLNKNKKIVQISPKVFEHLNISEIIILQNDSKEIQKNLFKRDGILYEIALLEKFQDEEIKHGKLVAGIMNITVKIIKSY